MQALHGSSCSLVLRYFCTQKSSNEMTMEINGTMYRILQQEEVTFGDGTKKMKGGFVIMRDGDYPRPVAFELFGEERLSMLNGINIGEPVRVSFYAESREAKNGNYYTTLRCFNIMQYVAAAATTPPPAGTAPISVAPTYTWNPASGTQQTQNQPPEILPHENDLPWDDDNTPF